MFEAHTHRENDHTDHKGADDPELNKLTNAALALLARREYSQGELRERLARKSTDSQLVEIVIEALQEQGLQSDLRFCENFVRYRIEQGKGPHKIRQDLRQKYISDALIQQCISDDAVFWSERAADIYMRKFKDKPPESEKERAKRLRFMVARGFSAHQVYDLID